jgi:phasin family protein
MSQAQKKPSAGQASAKLASTMANKAAQTGFAAVESTRSSAEHVLKIGSSAVRDFMSTGAGEAQKAQEKIFAAGREHAEHFAKSIDSLTQMMYDSVSNSRDNVETAMECGNMTASMVKDVSSELYDYANRSFAECVEMSKSFFACRTFNDLMELQSKAAKSGMDQFFSESVKLSNMFFEYASEVCEPMNERFSQVSEQFSKNLQS